MTGGLVEVNHRNWRRTAIAGGDSALSLCSAVSVLAPLLGDDFQIGDEQQVENVHAIVGLEHNRRPAACGERDEFPVMHRHVATIRKVDRELLKWLRVEHFA
jgi:hypothetical protein